MLLLISVAFTQEAKDPFDLSSIMEKIDEIGVPTVESVANLETIANELYNANKWEDAAEALNNFSKNANWLANLIKSGLDPYYGASYDDRKEYPYKKIKPLIEYESLTNEYIRKRNQAIIMEAECYEKLGDNKKAVALYRKGLELVNINNEVWWEKARLGLYNLIGLAK